MLHRTARQRWRRALVVLVTILGQFAVTGMAAGAQCVRARGAAVAVLETGAAAGLPGGAGAEELAPGGRSTDGPAGPGSLPCTTLVFVRPAPEAERPLAAESHGPMPHDEVAPKGIATPPPYHPPRA